jgi:nitrogen fixation/metabolism regulation signal transduction histidine kinase
VGVLEQKYVGMQKKVQGVFILITAAGVLVAVGMGYLLAHKFMKPIRSLISASREVSKGNLNPETGPISKDEIGVLQNTFIGMLSSIRERQTTEG